MAQKARKHIAKANADTLKNLHLGTLIVHSFFICEYVVEKTGRPKFDPTTKALKSAGEDLSAPGLTEYMFDVIWVTWGAIVSVIFVGNWGWLLWLAVPIFAVIKGYSLLGAARGMASGMQQQQQQQPDAVPAAGNRKQRRAA
ncbi:hypothetical protein PG991_004643 [Apiospora marii]|uniref:DUF788-domain-containing protein n=1 Tax=Apiospora marii TaxID=335849 RepID=A0ABR1S6X7_9PEZI